MAQNCKIQNKLQNSTPTAMQHNNKSISSSKKTGGSNSFIYCRKLAAVTLCAVRWLLVLALCAASIVLLCGATLFFWLCKTVALAAAKAVAAYAANRSTGGLDIVPAFNYWQALHSSKSAQQQRIASGGSRNTPKFFTILN